MHKIIDFLAWYVQRTKSWGIWSVAIVSTFCAVTVAVILVVGSYFVYHKYLMTGVFLISFGGFIAGCSGVVVAWYAMLWERDARTQINLTKRAEEDLVASYGSMDAAHIAMNAGAHIVMDARKVLDEDGYIAIINSSGDLLFTYGRRFFRRDTTPQAVRQTFRLIKPDPHE